MEKKKILLIYYKLFRAGGVAKVMTNLANELVEQNYEVEILLLNREQPHFYPLNDKVKVHNIDTFSHWAWEICEFNAKYLKFIPKIRNINAYIYHIGVYLMLKNWLNKNHHQYDTIISCWYKLSKIISFFPQVRKKTYAWEHISHTVGGVFWNKILKDRYKYLLGIISTNKPTQNYYKKINKNTLVIYNTMDDECENKEFTSAKDKKNVISVIARLDPEKNLTEFLDIIKQAKIPKDWTVKIMGDGSQKDILHKKTETESINVEFLGNGNITQVYQLLKESKINCLTSTAEALPTILIQAMFFSNVLMAYDCKYGPSDIINEKNGFLIPLHNKQLFVEKLEYLTQNRERYYELNNSSYQESKKWKKDKILEQWKNIL